MPKLTESLIAKIVVPPGKRDVLTFDESLRGFGIRKFDSGKASYFVKYSIGRQQRKFTLGPYVPGRLVDMRGRAADVLAKARLGEDVQADRKADRSRQVATVGELIPLYLKNIQSDLRTKTHYEYARYLKQHWAPLHARPVDEVDRTEVVTIIDRVADQSGKVAADRARSALGAFYSWVIDKGYRGSTPVVNIKHRAKGGGRERVITEKEIKAIWRALTEDDYSTVIKLLILTGQRRAEIGDLHWSEIDFDRKRIELPASRTKNKLPHIVPLSEAALSLLKDRPRRLGRDYVFGRGGTGFQGWSAAKENLDERTGLPTNWTVHDIRRSMNTLMNEHGIALPHVIEALLNHVSGDSKRGVAGTYNRAAYLDEKTKALSAWAVFLAGIVVDGKA